MGGRERTIDVFCTEGHSLFRYHKIGGGRLQKLYEDQITRDFTLPEGSEQLPRSGVIFCRECVPPRPVAEVTLIHGRRAYQVIQPGIRKVVT